MNKRLSSEELVIKLLKEEKNTRKENTKYSFQDLIGSWRLSFITGTKKSRQKVGIIIGKGFYLPSFININLTYSLLENRDNLEELTEIKGKVENTINVGLIKISLTGPTKFITKKNIMAFDFNHLTLSVLGIKIYETDVRGGQESEQQFYNDSVKKQAFFSYFLIEENLIAARGRGGGLAVWEKMKFK